MKKLFRCVIFCGWCVPLIACISPDPSEIDLSAIPTVEAPPTPTPRVQETFEPQPSTDATIAIEVLVGEPTPTPAEEAVKEEEAGGEIEQIDFDQFVFIAGETAIIKPNLGVSANFAVEPGKQYLLTAYSEGDASLIVYDDQGTDVQTEDGSGFGGSLERLVWEATTTTLSIGAGMDTTFGDAVPVKVSVFELGEAQSGPVSRPVAAGEAFLAVAVPVDETDLALLLESQAGESSFSWIDMSRTVEVEVLYQVQDNTISTIDNESKPIDSLIYTIPIGDPSCCTQVDPLPIAPTATEPIVVDDMVTRPAEETFGYLLNTVAGEEYLIATQSDAPVTTHLFDTNGNLLRTVYNGGFGGTRTFALWEGDGAPLVVHPVIDSAYEEDVPQAVNVTAILMGEFTSGSIDLSIGEGESYLVVAKPDGNYNVGLSMSQGFGSFSYRDNDRAIEVEVMNEPGEYEIEAVNDFGSGAGSVYVMPLDDTSCCLVTE